MTKSGEIIYPDRQMMLFAKDILAHHPGAQIVYDVKCTRRLVPWIEACGGVPTISCTGPLSRQGQAARDGRSVRGRDVGPSLLQRRPLAGLIDGVYAGARHP